MDINAFRTFVEVAKTLHFGNAAENLFVTQSAVSARIRNLEDNLGKKLFIREKGNVSLSPEGKAMLIHAKTIVATWGRAQQEVGLPEGMREGIVVGGISALWDTTLQPWLNRLLQSTSKLTITAEEHSAEILVERVLNGSIDVAFVYDAPQSESIEILALTEIPIRLVSTQKGLPLEHALVDDYVWVDWGASFAINHARNFPDIAITKLQVNRGQVAYDYITEFGGSAYLAESMVEHAIDEGELFYVKGAPIFERSMSAIYLSNSEKKETLLKLLKFL